MANNKGKESGSGVGCMAMLFLFAFSPGLMLAVMLNYIAPVNGQGLIPITLIGAGLTFYACYTWGAKIGHVSSGITLYLIVSVLATLAITSDGALSKLFDQSSGKIPYDSLIMNETGQLIFWSILVFAVFVGVLAIILPPDKQQSIDNDNNIM